MALRDAGAVSRTIIKGTPRMKLGGKVAVITGGSSGSSFKRHRGWLDPDEGQIALRIRLTRI